MDFNQLGAAWLRLRELQHLSGTKCSPTDHHLKPSPESWTSSRKCCKVPCKESRDGQSLSQMMNTISTYIITNLKTMMRHWICTLNIIQSVYLEDRTWLASAQDGRRAIQSTQVTLHIATDILQCRSVERPSDCTV